MSEHRASGLTGNGARRSRFELRLRNIDVFTLFNITIFFVLCVFRYYDRFIQYRGPANIAEFFVYAGAIVAAVIGLWLAFRPYFFPSALLAAVEIGILAHFAGAFVPVDGHRLYDVYLAGIRYDKYVHFTNALVVSFLLSHIFQKTIVASRAFLVILIVLVVLGLGTIIEIIEYFVCRTIPRNGVGGYDNNMQDLIANVVGSLAWVTWSCLRPPR